MLLTKHEMQQTSESSNERYLLAVGLHISSSVETATTILS